MPTQIDDIREEIDKMRELLSQRDSTNEFDNKTRELIAKLTEIQRNSRRE